MPTADLREASTRAAGRTGNRGRDRGGPSLAVPVDICMYARKRTRCIYDDCVSMQFGCVHLSHPKW